MRRLLAGVLAGALLAGCSGGASSKSSVTTTLPESVVNNGTTTANQVIERLTRAGMPIGLTTPHPTDDPVFQEFDELLVLLLLPGIERREPAGVDQLIQPVPHPAQLSV